MLRGLDGGQIVKVTLIIEEVTIHRVELDCDSVALAEAMVLEHWNSWREHDDDPYVDCVNLLESREGID